MPNLTDTFIANLDRPATGQVIHWDNGHKHAVPGFGLKIAATGAKAFVFNYRNSGGRLRRIKIGEPPTYSAKLARERAKDYRYIVDKGGDPLAEKQDARNEPTMADLCQRYLRDYAPTKRTSSATSDEMAIRLYILPALKAKKIVEVTFDDIGKLHHKIGKDYPIRANRVVALLSKMFNLSKRWYERTLPTGERVPLRSDNPAKGIDRNPENKRKRYLKAEELARLTAVLAEYGDQQAANIIRLLLLTGARSGEVLGMRWDQLDLEAGNWTKPGATTKQRTEHEVPLSAPARQLLSELRAKAAKGTEYVFPGRAGVGHRVDLKKVWPAICKAAKIEGLRVHDLRHSYASFLVSAGLSLPVIGALLGHTQPSTTARYAHIADDPQRKATETVGAIVEGAGKPGAELAALKARGAA
jgi:integrase